MTTHPIDHGLAQPLCVIGDVHGRLDLLEAMLAQIDAEVPTPRRDILVLGDMIDRGPDSAGVLKALHARADVHCLMGNHERMMLDFLDDPIDAGPRWFRNGGDATLQSFGINPHGTVRLPQLRDQLAEAMGENLVTWCNERPLMWTGGHVVVAHAGMDPKHPPSKQKHTSLLWGHRRFLKRARQDGLAVVHGHWISSDPTFVDGRVAIDTGAWTSGRLSAAVFNTSTADGGELRFLTVEGPPAG